MEANIDTLFDEAVLEVGSLDVTRELAAKSLQSDWFINYSEHDYKDEVNDIVTVRFQLLDMLSEGADKDEVIKFIREEGIIFMRKLIDEISKLKKLHAAN